MKRTTIIAMFCLLAGLFCCSSLMAQDQPVKKVQYNFINEYGWWFGKNVGFSGVFVNGVCINQFDAIGIGVGYGINSATFQEIPLFANYRHYFNRGRKLLPCINVALGASFHLWDEYVNYFDEYGYWERRDELQQHGVGLYSTIAGGFKVKAFSFTGGFFFRTFPHENLFNGGIEIKVGYTF